MKTRSVPIAGLLAESKGFTLIEIMVVIIILGLLATLVIPNITGYTEKAKREKARADIASLEGALELFKADNGFYPTTEQGLDALIIKPSTGRIPAKWMDGGYFKKGLPLDPWGNRYAVNVAFLEPTGTGAGNVNVSNSTFSTNGSEHDDSDGDGIHLANFGAVTFTSVTANDNFANAATLTGTSATANGTTVEATRENASGEPDSCVGADCPGFEGGHTVWYSWTAPSSGSATVDTCTASIDSVLAVYTGSALNALTRVVNANNLCPTGFGSTVTFDATGGTTYKIGVDDCCGAQQNTFTINANLRPARSMRGDPGVRMEFSSSREASRRQLRKTPSSVLTAIRPLSSRSSWTPDSGRGSAAAVAAGADRTTQAAIASGLAFRRERGGFLMETSPLGSGGGPPWWASAFQGGPKGPPRKRAGVGRVVRTGCSVRCSVPATAGAVPGPRASVLLRVRRCEW